MEELQLLLAERVMIRSVLSMAMVIPGLCNMEELELLLAERVTIRSVLSMAETALGLCNMELELLLAERIMIISGICIFNNCSLSSKIYNMRYCVL